MTKPITYIVTFRTDQDSASEEVTAASPEAALADARAIAGDHGRLTTLHFKPYARYSPVEEIVVNAPDGEIVAEWVSPDLLLRLAADDLFNALEKAVIALNTTRKFKVTKLSTDSYAIAAHCGRAIAKAKGDNDPNAA